MSFSHKTRGAMSKRFDSSQTKPTQLKFEDAGIDPTITALKIENKILKEKIDRLESDIQKEKINNIVHQTFCPACKASGTEEKLEKVYSSNRHPIAAYCPACDTSWGMWVRIKSK